MFIVSGSPWILPPSRCQVVLGRQHIARARQQCQPQVVHLAIANGRFTFKYGGCPLVVMDASNRSAGASDYTASLNLKVKVLDFVKSGGPKETVLRTFRWEVAL